MFPSTEPTTTRPEEQLGEEKKGVSRERVHSTAPLSCVGPSTKKVNHISRRRGLASICATEEGAAWTRGPAATHGVKTEEVPSQRGHVQVSEGGVETRRREHSPAPAVAFPHTLASL